MSLIDELKRRNVFKVSAAYLALSWVVTEVTGAVVPALHLPDSIPSIVVWLGVIGFPFVLVFAWVYELTPEGLKRESEVDRSQSIAHVTSKRLDYIIIGMLAVAIGLFVLQYLRPPTVEAPVTATEPAAVPPQPPAVQVAAPAGPQTAQAILPDDKSIAVLPFVNMSPDKDQDYFADGISEELLNLLAKVPELRVIARTSSFSFKGKEVDIAEIAHKLNVANVLEGSVRKSGDMLRITVQLVRASDSSHLWSQTYDRLMADVFKVQDEIAAAVVAQLKIHLLGAAPKLRVTDPRAYALFLQAREIGRQSTNTGLEQSNNLYQQVLALDPGYVAAWEGLASNYLNQAFFGLIPVDEGIRLTREATNKALALEPARATALLWLSYIASHYDLDLSAAAQHLGDALALEPTNPDILAEAGALIRRLVRLDEAIAIGEYQVGLDPINPLGYEFLGSAYFYAGRLDDALAAWRTILNLSPSYIGAHEGTGEVLLAKGDTKAALSEMQQEVHPGLRLIGLSMANHALGQEIESDAALTESIQKYSKEYPFMIAYAYAYRGETDRAFEWLHKAVEYHDLYLVAVAGHPMLMKIHSDPRWLPFLRKHGMAPDQLARIKFAVKLPQ